MKLWLMLIDRGGTFCDCIGVIPGQEDVVIKLLSVDPANYDDAPTEGIRRILEIATGATIPRGVRLDTSLISKLSLLHATDQFTQILCCRLDSNGNDGRD